MDAVYEKDIVVEFGGSLSSGGSNQVFLQLNYNYWQKTASAVRLNASFGRFYNSFLMGGKMEFPGRNPKFLEVEYTFNQFNYYRTNSFFFMDDSPSYLYENNNYLRIDGGFPISYKGKVELGITIGKNRADYFHINNATQEDKADQTKFNFYSPYFEIEINTFNRKQYSNQGKRFYSALHFISGTEKHLPGTTSVQSGNYIDYHNYFAFNIDFDQYYRPGKIYVPGLHVSMCGNTLNQFRNYTSTTLFMKPYQPLYEMSTTYQAEFRPAGYIALGMRNIFTITRNIDIRTDAFLMAPFRELSSNNQQQVKFSEIFPALHKVLSASFVYNTPIGPLSASLSYFDDDLPLSFFVNLGYIIFNRSAF
jgi:NTE family protein